MSNNILLVRVPAVEAVNGRELRDYILESLAQGVLVLTEDASCEVMELPPLGGVEVVPGETPRRAPSQSLAEPMTASPEGGPETAEGEEKRAILQRLTDYRKAGTLGCLNKVARATRTKGRISDNTLRMLLTGDTVLPIEDWRRIGRALDTLAAGEAADG